ncbi:MAG: tripartite tricarboxylate transporter substrate binding protein [Fusobacteriaceae bacterium]|jgi:tripartite-type tricarboxylate transporter receptor subunit TctC|nr:tripartite tricarboxylate transporter substrate binding protein [Fusobacteriaceae bacterium]
MRKKGFRFSSILLLGIFVLLSTISLAKYPARDINLKVPYNPGGSTDLTARALGETMGKELGVSFIVTNTPGAGGAVGSTAIYNATKDGYNILANGMMAFVAMPVLDTLKTTTAEWDFWLATFTPNVVVVRKDSPYKTMEDLIKALKDNPGKITVGTAGPGSGGHVGIEVLRSGSGIEYKHVPYQGGNPAIIATLAGEVDMTTQLLVEMEDMIKAGDLRALAAFTPDDIVIKDGPTIPSILKFIPNLKDKIPLGETTGITVPKGIPDEALKALDDAFDKAIKSKEFIDFCARKGFIIVGKNRKDAVSYMENLASVITWTLYDAGVAKKSPEEFNIKRSK